MTLAFAPDYGLSFLRGMFATVNPCGFVLLPTYLIYFLGMEASGAAAQNQRATVRRALLVGTAVAAGFMGVFVVVGLLSGTLHTWFVEQSKYITLVLGAGFVILGTAILAGYRPKFATPNLGIRVRSRNVTTMFLYGVGYAVASLGCTMIIFVPVITSPRSDSFATSFVNVVMFAAGMGLVVIALTLSLALANQVLLRTLRRVMRYVDLLAGAFMVLSGLYLVWYFVVVDVQEDSDTVTGAMRRWERRVTTQLNDNWQLIAAVLVIIVGAAVTYTVLRRPAADTSIDGASPASGGDGHRAS